MRRRRFIKAAGASGVTMVAGCSGNATENTSNKESTSNANSGGTTIQKSSSGPITIAALEPQSSLKPWSWAHLTGLRIAIDEINASGKLDSELELVVSDTKSDGSRADSAFRKHVEQNDAVAVTGAVSSDVGIRLSHTAEDLEVPNLLHMSGSGKVLNSETRYTFRVGWLPAASHVRADIDFLRSKNASSMGAIVADYAWGQAVKSNLEKLVPNDVDLHVEVAPIGADDFRSYLRRIPEVDVMSFLGHPFGAATATKQLFQLQRDPLTLGVDMPQNVTIAALGKSVTNNVISRHISDVTSSGFEQLGKKVAERADKPMYAFVPNGYVTAKMVGEAALNVGNDPKAVADYIRNNSFDYLYNRPISYTEWGELKKPVLQYSEFVEGSPSYDSKGKYHLNPVASSDPIPAPKPGQ